MKKNYEKDFYEKNFLVFFSWLDLKHLLFAFRVSKGKGFLGVDKKMQLVIFCGVSGYPGFVF